MEALTGARWDANGGENDTGENDTMAGLSGMVARAMGESSHQEKDDIVAGLLIRQILAGGMSPDDLKKLSG